MLLLISSCNEGKKTNLLTDLPTDNSRVWIGNEYWANPLQDWQLNHGQIECVGSGGYRNIFLLTNEIGSEKGDFKLSVKAKNLVGKDTLTKGWIGFEIGVRGEFNDYRDSAIRGRGFPIGITTSGQMFIGNLDSEHKVLPEGLPDDFTLEVSADQQKNGKYKITLKVKDAAKEESISRDDVQPEWIEGGISLMCHSGALKEFPGKLKLPEYPSWGTSRDKRRGGNVKFGFSDLKVSGSKIVQHKEQAYGPILFTQHTLSNKILKLTAQMPPIGEKDGQVVEFQTKTDGKWKTMAKANINKLSRTATFKLKNWDTSKDIPYRVAYQLYDSGNTIKDYYFEGSIRKEPLDKEEIVVAGFTGNNDLGFPNTDIFKSVKYQNPDLLFFSGDQIYEGVGDYGALINRKNVEKSTLDYLRKWYLFGWAYGDLLKEIPSVCLTDDHDMYHGNIWGAGGIPTPEGLGGAAAQDLGGYKMPPEWVNMVQRTQTSHMPDPFDPTPVAQGIGVYYTDMKYAGISFAMLEDRKFKSAPKPLLPKAKIYNGWMQNVNFDAAKNADVKGAVLLGDRQLKFLEHWSADWSNNTWMKVVLSQTIFANVATLPYADSHSDNIVPKLRILKKGEYPPDDVPVSDFDSNAWPQTGRNKAVKTIRKSFAFHYAGDQHLGSTIQYGVDDFNDAGYAFCVPSISNVWPRRWYPSIEGKNRKKGDPRYTGEYVDGFGNKISVHAISNPVFTGKKPSKLYDRATGYGIVRFNKNTRDITIECWPRQADPKTDKQYDGWPVVINQSDNFLKNARLFLPEIQVKGMKNPVVQVIDEKTDEIVFTIRIKGTKYQPKVLKKGNYTIKVGEPGTGKEKVLSHLPATDKKGEKVKVQF
ncbi:MAG: twin-arginine translocation pathway signal protein [Flavobacteriia bacterium]|nr:MAG: twin-arginine translocation pathway signal protein [Flavobacteriia bacterium]